MLGSIFGFHIGSMLGVGIPLYFLHLPNTGPFKEILIEDVDRLLSLVLVLVKQPAFFQVDALIPII